MLYLSAATRTLRLRATRLLLAGALLIGARETAAQTATPADTLHKFEAPASPAAVRKPWYCGKLVRATVVPAVLIGYGVSTINGHGFYSSYQAKADLHGAFPRFHTRVDDYLIYAPYLELGAVALVGVESRDDRINTLILLAKTEIIMVALTTGLKYSTKILRPDSSARNSFPSGHTAQAFLAASIVHTEFRERSQWYGIGAYTIATSVAALRMLNNRHWQSDVFAGAGIGILSAHLGYLAHRHRWGRKPRERRADVGLTPTWSSVGLTPTWSSVGGAGMALTWRLRR